MKKPPTSPIGLGTAAIGRPQYINLRQEMVHFESLDTFWEKGMDTLEAAYKLGVRYFDTAPGYGMSEQMLVEWVEMKNDPSIEIATKWGYTYTANYEHDAIIHEVKDHSIKQLNRQWDHSYLLLPFLTTYQIHSASFETGVLKNEEVLNRLAEIKTKHNLKIGLTTSGADHMDVLKYALDVEVNQQPLFEVFQVTYNILDQSLSDLAGQIHAAGFRIIVKEALANGRLFPHQTYEHYHPLYEQLKRLAEKYHVGIDAIALRFCVESLEPYKVLSGGSTVHHVEENVKANSIELEPEDLSSLRSFATEPENYWHERKRLGWN